MAKTNTGLAEYAKQALTESWGYVYGTYGKLLTEAYLKDKIKQYPKEVGGKESIVRKWLGRKVADCIGLIKGYLWTNDAGKLIYDANQDFGANGMFKQAKVKGDIKTLPETPGLILYLDGHAGVYIGGGYAIEARGSAYGVVKTKVSERPWTHWYQCPFIEYVEEEKTMMSEDAVKEDFEIYEVHVPICGYISAADAKSGKNPKTTVNPKAYNVYNKAQGMINVTTDIRSPGSWINPGDNRKLESDYKTLCESYQKGIGHLQEQIFQLENACRELISNASL